MGLDNSIQIKRNTSTNSIPKLKQFELAYDNKHQFDFEICYWRKCYNIRNMIMDVVESARDNDNSDILTTTDIEKITHGLQSFNSANWQENGGSIWDWDDEEYPYSEKIQRDIENLKNLQTLMEKYDLEVYFYDSY